MKLVIGVFALFMSVSFVRAQEGYFGKKFLIGIDAIGNVPLLSGHFNDATYRVSSDQMKTSKSLFDYGYGFTFLRNVNRRHSIGLMLNAKSFDMSAPEFYTTYYVISPLESNIDTSWLRMESVACRTFSGFIVGEFFTRKGMAPVGFSHQVGLGFSISELKNKVYNYSINEFGNTAEFEDKWTPVDAFAYNGEAPAYKSVSLLYGINMRMPLTNRFAVDFGVKYLFNLYLKPGESQFKENDIQPFSYEDAYFYMQRKNLMSLHIKLGMSYLF